MTNTPIQITTDLSTVLERIDQRLESLEKELSDFRTESKVAIESLKGDIKGVQGEIKALDTKVNGLKEEVKGDIKALDTKVNGLKEDIKEIKGSQKNQIWSLIVLAFTAVLGTIGALARVFFVSNP
jgi:peptidoglycan hydrolase CwlO-like protein